MSKSKKFNKKVKKSKAAMKKKSENMTPNEKIKLLLTDDVITDVSIGTYNLIKDNYDSVEYFLAHMLAMMSMGDWGFSSEENRRLNETALKKNSGTLLGCYMIGREPVMFAFNIDHQYARADLLRERQGKESNE